MYFSRFPKSVNHRYSNIRLQYPDLDHKLPIPEYGEQESYASLELICRDYAGEGVILFNIDPVNGADSRRMISHFGIDADRAADVADKARKIAQDKFYTRSAPLSFEIEFSGTLFRVYLFQGRRDYFGRQVLAFISNRALAFSAISEILFLSSWLFDRVAENPELRNPDFKKVTLTRIEADCLYWTAEGKTSEEISIILDLSPHTINHCIARAGAKLNTTNRTHTVVTAAKLGLI